MSGLGYPEDPIVTLEQWRDRCRRLGLTSSDQSEAFKKAFDRAKKILIEKGLVQHLDGYVWKVGAHD